MTRLVRARLLRAERPDGVATRGSAALSWFNQVPVDRPAAIGAPAGGVDASAWRALAVFRALTLIYALILNLAELGQTGHPRWALATLAVMVLWSGFTSYAYSRLPWGRSWPVLAADMVVTILTILATLIVKTPEQIAAGEMTLPTVWGASVVLAWAIRWRLVGGLWGTFCIAAANFVVDRGQPSRATIHSIVLVLLAGAVIGYVILLAQRAEGALAEAIRLQAATAERERLSREIHDGVLQVLALVRRRGAELGYDAAELARMATEQEAALRALISSGPAIEHGGGLADVRELLATPARSPQVHLASPATPVLLPAAAAQQLVAAVGEALHNVRHHVGLDADAWILVESTPEEVVVTVRDDGPGIAPDRLAAAESEGHLGVAQSIVGRLRDLGGTAIINSAPGEGTEVELHVPR
jgi:signal transduction histidine kinase